jgi:hypothetical protein
MLPWEELAIGDPTLFPAKETHCTDQCPKDNTAGDPRVMGKCMAPSHRTPESQGSRWVRFRTQASAYTPH